MNYLMGIILLFSFGTKDAVNDNWQGYKIEDDTIIFRYQAAGADEKVYVCGNFMGWERNDPDWKMQYEADGYHYLRKKIEEIRTPDRSFYEFTFLVNDELVDADKKAEHVIHCAGHGYRYVIKWNDKS